MTATSTLATDRQIQYLASLWEQIARGVIASDPENGPEAALALRENADDLLTGRATLTKSEASNLITRAKANASQYRREVPTSSRTTAPATTVGPGLYIQQDTIYKVVLSARDRLYAKRLVPGGTRGRWEFAPGKVASLSPADALTPERAAEWGRIQRPGHDGSIDVYCAVCGAELNNQESRDRGIGPVCYRRVWGR